MNLHYLRNENLVAILNASNSQLCSLRFRNTELMHGGGLPEEMRFGSDNKGWSNSEIMMWPVIGKVPSYSVEVDGKSHPMDQHGIARLLKYEVVDQKENSITFATTYIGNTPIQNPRAFADPSRPTHLTWPNTTRITKKFTLVDKALFADFTIEDYASTPAPHEFGWHPAFRIPGNPSDTLLSPSGQPLITFDQIRSTSQSGALHVPEALSIEYSHPKLGVDCVKISYDMGNAQIWTPPENNLVCIEPVTHLHKGGFRGFDLDSIPASKTAYRVSIEPQV